MPLQFFGKMRARQAYASVKSPGSVNQSLRDY